jgi:endonuclease G, mitochondrial
MKRKIIVALALIALLSLFTTLALHAQDVVTLKHKAYTTYYSKSKHYPVKVEWWITKASLTCDVKVKRGDKFIPDPLLPAETNLQTDYTGAGFDRGHNMPAADASCDQVANEESFYFSNMTAQYPALNRGDWKSLEMLSRETALRDDSVHVWAGSIGEAKKIGTTTVPTHCWKVIYVVKTKEWMAFVFDNTTDKADGINNNKVTVADVEKLTHLHFKAKH